MKWLKNLKQDARYIIGVSGGPDSMALLAMCRVEHIDIIVAHMNYQKRKSALRDEEIVKAYCEKYAIPCVIKRQQEACVGNFQAFAREKRYFFYQTLLQEYQADAVLLAHHLDDHLETYLMQKMRHSVGNVYGIAVESNVYGCKVIRPLMEYTKQDLLAYCIQHQVPYGFDESNFSDDYLRNRIRHRQIDHMSRKEKESLQHEIALENHQLQQFQQEASEFLKDWQEDCESLLALPDELKMWVLRYYIYQHTKLHLSQKFLVELMQLLVKANHWTTKLDETYALCKEYGKLAIVDTKPCLYAYEIQDIDDFKSFYCPYCHSETKGATIASITLDEKDFPLTIRNVKQGDAIQLRFGKKKIHRWFIDRKIPSWQRKMWPVVENAANEVIFVPEIGCDIAHFSNNPSVFVVK